MSEQVEKRFDELESLATTYAEAQAQAEYLDDYTKSLLATLMKAAEAEGKASSAVIQEREARRDGQFITHLQGKKAATERALALKWKLTIAQMRFEWARTKAANRRAEMNLR
jgi:hypothetical protein